MKNTITTIATCFLILTIISCTTKGNKNENKSSELTHKNGDNPSAHNHKISDVNGEQYSTKVNNGTIKTDTLKGSPERTAMGNIGDCHIHIIYSSPGTKGRVIWGGLVPLNQLWVTGAHNATSINFNENVNINGKRIKKGEYAFFTIPGKESWTLIFNTRVRQHLTDDYNQSEDVLRIQVTPEKLPFPVQRLTYKVKETSERDGIVSMEWDSLKVSFSITGIDTN